ncbi:MAG: hypothetical protein LRY55_15450 [Leadbetterella sp.]|nr:hypothetical protein [Leadbetterella sp.]
MPRYLLLFAFLSAVLYAQAQEEEYYKVPEKRKGSHEVENLPHLESRFSSFYFGLSGGLRKPYHGRTPDFGSFAENNSSLNEWIELNVGLNMNNNFFVETGVIRLKNHFSSYVFSSPVYPPFIMTVRNRQWYVPVVFKKRVFNLNRVTKNAYVNLGLGGGFLVSTRPAPPHQYSFDIQQSLQSRDLEYFNVTLSQSRSLMYGEVGAELKGNITERLEILVFFKGIFRKPEYLSNTFDIQFRGGSPQRYGVFEKTGSLVFGLQGRFNSRKFYRYTSRI